MPIGPLARRAFGAAVVLACASGFAWPGTGERLVKELTSARSPRDKRDALRLAASTRVIALEGASRELVVTLTHDADPEVRLEAWTLLAQHDGLAAWRSAWQDPAPEVRAQVASALARLGERALLLQGARDEDARVRAASMRGLATWEDARSATLLTDALGDPALEVRMAAARALGAQPRPNALEQLLMHVDDGFPEQRAVIIEALGSHAQQQDPRVAAALEAALDDADEAVVQASLRVYHASPRRVLPSSVPALTRSASLEVAASATRLLERASTVPLHAQGEPPWLTPLARTADAQQTLRESEDTLRQLELLLPVGAVLATDPLQLWLAQAPRPLRARIASLIARTGGPLSDPTLRTLLDESEPALLAAYVHLAAQVEAPEGELRLLPLLEHHAVEVREAAVSVLFRSVKLTTFAALIDRLRSQKSHARAVLLRVLARGLTRFAPTLGTLTTKDQRAALRAQLAQDLASADDTNASRALAILSADDSAHARALVLADMTHSRPGRRIAALRASILDHGTPAQAARRRSLDDDDVGVAATAVVTLALAHDPLPVTWLVSRLDAAAWPIGPAASFALARGMAQRDPRLSALSPCPWLASKEPVTRHNIAWAAAQLGQAVCAESTRGQAPAPRAQPAPPVAHSSLPEGVPRTLYLRDGLRLVSMPDAAGQIGFSSVELVSHAEAWRGLYARE